MTSPIDAIANAQRAACGLGAVTGLTADDLSVLTRIALKALTCDAVIDHAMAAVRNHTWTAPDVEDLSDRELGAVLRVAFGSVAKEGS